MKSYTFFLICLIGLLLPLNGQTNVVKIIGGEVVNGTVGDGRSFELEKTDPVAQLKIVLSILDESQQSQVQAHCVTKKGFYIGEVIAPDSVMSNTASRVLCKVKDTRSSTKRENFLNLVETTSIVSEAKQQKEKEETNDVTGYYIHVMGTIGAPYLLQPVFVNQQLHIGDTSIKTEATGYNTTFWFFDVNTTHAPAEVTVHSSSNELATLRVVLDDCSFLSAASSMHNGNLILSSNKTKHKTAFMDFEKKARLNIGLLNPGLESGRWYLAVQTHHVGATKDYSVSIKYGLPYDEYNSRTLTVLFLFPVALIVSLLFPFALTIAVNKTNWGLKVTAKSGQGRGADTKSDIPPFLEPEQENSLVYPSRHSNGLPKDSSLSPLLSRGVNNYNTTSTANGGEDLHREKYTKRNSAYLPYVLICGLFFVIPAVQMSAYEVDFLNDNGDRNVCYYNTLCAKPTKILEASNNVWSNVGYCWASVVLIVYIFILRRVLRCKRLVPRNSFVVLSIAAALFLEGILSGVYHVCPNRTVFQFDTAFMFVISGLMMVEIYRKYYHTHFPAWGPFTFFALLLVMNYAASVIDTRGNSARRAYERYIYRSALTVVVCFITVLLLYLVYFMPRTVSKEMRSRSQYSKFIERIKRRPLHPFRALFIFLWFAVMIFFLWSDPNSDLSQTLLALMVGSFLIWLAAYTLHKLRRIMIPSCKRIWKMIVVPFFSSSSPLSFRNREGGGAYSSSGNEVTTLLGSFRNKLNIDNNGSFKRLSRREQFNNDGSILIGPTTITKREESSGESSSSSSGSGIGDDTFDAYLYNTGPLLRDISLDESRSRWEKFQSVMWKLVVIALWLYLVVPLFVLWGVALVFFKYYTTTDKNLTPAQSLDLNTECLLSDFWDAHDIWHFISAAALFWGTLLVIHMDINERKRIEQIDNKESLSSHLADSDTDSDLERERDGIRKNNVLWGNTGEDDGVEVF